MKFFKHHFLQRRCTELKEKGIRFVGCGVSGGEEGTVLRFIISCIKFAEITFAHD